MLKQVARRFFARREPESALAIDPANWVDWLDDNPPPEPDSIPFPLDVAQKVSITVCGDAWLNWRVHLRLQRIPLPAVNCLIDQVQCLDPHNLSISFNSDKVELSGECQHIALNLELPPVERAKHWFSHLQSQHVVFDPDLPRVALLRELGLHAVWLNPSTPANGWLDWSEQDRAQLGAQLGLAAPVPAVCLLLGEAGEAWEHALADWELNGESPTIHYLPGLPEKANCDFASARLMAAWLMHASELSDHLVTLDSSGLGVDHCLSCL